MELIRRIKNLRSPKRPTAFLNKKEETQEDDLGSRRKYRTADKSRTNDRSIRFISFALMLSLCVNVIAVHGLVTNFELREYIPIIIQAKDKREQVVNAEALVKGSERSKYIAEAEVMSYVKMRHEVIPDTKVMSWRWDIKCLDNRLSADEKHCAFIRKYSTVEAYTAFIQKNAEPVNDLIKNDIFRRVEIDADPIEKGPNLFEVWFTITDYKINHNKTEDDIIRRKKLVSNIWWYWSDAPMDDADRKINPLGFKVEKYRTSVRKEGGRKSPKRKKAVRGPAQK